VFAWNPEFIRGHEVDSAAPPTREFKGDHEIRNEKRVLKEYPPDRTILFSRTQWWKRSASLGLQKGGSFVAESIDDMAGTASFAVTLDLGAWALKEAMVVEQLEPPQKVLGMVGEQRRDLGGTQKSMPVNQTNNLPVTVRDLDWRDFFSSFETRKAAIPH
jgi:hypothetical protein